MARKKRMDAPGAQKDGQPNHSPCREHAPRWDGVARSRSYGRLWPRQVAAKDSRLCGERTRFVGSVVPETTRFERLAAVTPRFIPAEVAEG